MKRLIKFKAKHYLYFILLVMATASLGVGIALMKVEATFKVMLVADSYKPVFVLLSSDIYKVKPHQKVALKVSNKYYYGRFGKVFYDNDTKLFKARISDIAINMVPSSRLEAQVIYDTKRLYELVWE